MRICHVVPTYLPATRYGGTIPAVHGLCKALVECGHEVHVFTTNVDGANDSSVPLGVPVELDGVFVWYFPSTWFRRLYWAPALAKELKRQIATFDIVHLHSVFLWPTWVSARLALKSNVPYLVTPHGMLVKSLIKKKSQLLKSVWVRLIERRNLEAAAGIHVTASIEREELLKFRFTLPAVFEVPNGINLDEMTSADEPVVDGPYILFLGRINWKKGLDKLIKAMVGVEGLRLVIAGNDEENYQPRLEELVSSLGLSDRIKFMGPIIGSAKWRLFKDAKIFVLPSRSENFGIAVLEAMAMGCPVLVSPDVGLADVVRLGQCGMVVDSSPENIAKTVSRLMATPDELRKMGERGKTIAHNKFGWTAVAAEMEQVYLEIAGGAG